MSRQPGASHKRPTGDSFFRRSVVQLGALCSEHPGLEIDQCQRQKGVSRKDGVTVETGEGE
jgi:hypothetical protein